MSFSPQLSPLVTSYQSYSLPNDAQHGNQTTMPTLEKAVSSTNLDLFGAFFQDVSKRSRHQCDDYLSSDSRFHLRRDLRNLALSCYSEHSPNLADMLDQTAPSPPPLLGLDNQTKVDAVSPMMRLFQLTTTVLYVLNILNIITNLFAYAVFRRQIQTSASQTSGGVMVSQHVLFRLLQALSLAEVFFQFCFLVSTYLEEQPYKGNLAFYSRTPRTLSLHLLHNSSASSSYNDTEFPFAKVYCVLFLQIFIPLFAASHIYRNWLVVLISIYRFEAVMWPVLTRKRFVSPNRVTSFCVGIAACAILASLPRMVERNCLICPIRIPCIFPDNNSLTLPPKRSLSGFPVLKTIGQIDKTSQAGLPQMEVHGNVIIGFGKRGLGWRSYNYAYVITTLFVLQTGGPILLVCYLGVSIIIGISRHARKRNQLFNGQKSLHATSAYPTQSDHLLSAAVFLTKPHAPASFPSSSLEMLASGKTPSLEYSRHRTASCEPLPLMSMPLNASTDGVNRDRPNEQSSLLLSNRSVSFGGNNKNMPLAQEEHSTRIRESGKENGLIGGESELTPKLPEFTQRPQKEHDLPRV
ncbi:unnamed protein product, partial [Protopolystoma xenopodis]